MKALVAVTFLAACSQDSTSPAHDEAAAACAKGDGAQCMVAATGLDYTVPAQLRKAIGYWQTGCRAKHGPACAQLATVAEFGMETGGKEPDKVRAIQYYDLACTYGDAKSCERAGHPAPEAPKPVFAWDDALRPVIRGHAELGPLFDGLVLGQPMPDAMTKQVEAFKTQYHAHVNYYRGDRDLLSPWSLEVTFDEPTGSREAIARVWGPFDLAWGAWTHEHLRAAWIHGSTRSGVSWSPYRSPAEVIAPDDKTKLGFEPIPVIGAKLEDLRTALDGQILRTAEDEYRWQAIDAGEVHVWVKGGIVTRLETVNWFTNDPAIGNQLFALLAQKWGTPKSGHEWTLPGRHVKAWMPADGNFAISVERR
ncbi:MAG TPA: hypothetical protein VGM88_22285 [Kofleriaceae bacterium]|jgi:hypothetical protein